MTATDVDLEEMTRELLGAAPLRTFDPTELAGLPAPVKRYFEASIAPGADLATVVRLRMRGHIRIGRWLRFRGDEVLAPTHGFVWRARAAGVISGYDAYVDGQGTQQWRALRLATLMRATGSDVSTSSAGRCGGEGIWLPSALLPEHGINWTAPSADEIVARFQVHTVPIELHLHLDQTGLPKSVDFERWGDPDGTGVFGWHRFGGDVLDYASFNGFTIPSEGVWGWHHGTDRWSKGAFFRSRITAHDTRSDK